MLTDPIADMLTRIRNATMAGQERTQIPLSHLKKAIAEILKAEGFISDFRIESDSEQSLTVYLKYGRDRKPAIAGLKRKSRPGRRVYVGCTDIPQVMNGFGMSILSTSHGLMTDRTAREKRVGGELLCEVW